MAGSKVDFNAAIEHFRELGDQFDPQISEDREKMNLYRGLAHLTEALQRELQGLKDEIRQLKNDVDRIRRGA